MEKNRGSHCRNSVSCLGGWVP